MLRLKKLSRGYLIFLIIFQSVFSQNEEAIDNFELEVLTKLEEKIKFIEKENIKIDKDQRNFINGIIRKYKPKKLLELGVLHGGTSLVMLNSIKDIEGAKLFSYDMNKLNRANKKTITGYVVNEFEDIELKEKWTLIAGKKLPDAIGEIGQDIDFVLMDFGNEMPGKLLDFLFIFPFLKKNAIIVVRNIMYQFSKKMEGKYTSSHFLYTILRGKPIFSLSEEKKSLSNIGAIILDDDQEKYLTIYFLALCEIWPKIPSGENKILYEEHFRKHFELKYFNIYQRCLEKNMSFKKKKKKNKEKNKKKGKKGKKKNDL